MNPYILVKWFGLNDNLNPVFTQKMYSVESIMNVMHYPAAPIITFKIFYPRDYQHLAPKGKQRDLATAEQAIAALKVAIEKCNEQASVNAAIAAQQVPLHERFVSHLTF